MCSGSKSKLRTIYLEMEGGVLEQELALCSRSCWKLMELAANDDLTGFIGEVEGKGCDIDEMSCWYGRKIGSRKMGFEERTPIMIASLYGSIKVVQYIIGTGKVDVNWACGSDGATALHCAAGGGADSSLEVVKLLIEACADIGSLDSYGKRPADLIPPCVKSAGTLKRRALEILLNGVDGEATEEAKMEENANQQLRKARTEKKEYPVDASLPDINTGIYGMDEFRMYSFKVKPCSRAYSHDWTECAFAHPGENARRRDPRKYHYSCVPCPEFKKGTCAKGDACEYSHGVFESWLHPAQYKTRLCKDEIGCSRKVCFFAHKPEELRPLYASTGSAMPSPKSVSSYSVDMGALNPLVLGSPLPMPGTSTPPMSPVAASSPMGASMWQNKVNFTPPALQLPGSRLKAASSVRDLDFEMELLGLESSRIQQQQRQQYLDEMASISSPSCWNNEYNRIGELKPTNLDDVFGSLDPSSISPWQGLSPRLTSTSTLSVQSPTEHQICQNVVNHLRASYPSNLSSSPARKPSTFGFDSSAAVAAAVMNSRSAAFSKRSQSFIDRTAVNPHPTLKVGANSTTLSSSNLSEWSSPNGKLDWGFNGEERHRLQKSASFGLRNGKAAVNRTAMAPPSVVGEPDVSWVHSLVKDVPSSGSCLSDPSQQNGGIHDNIPAWFDQLYIEQEQIMA